MKLRVIWDKFIHGVNVETFQENTELKNQATEQTAEQKELLVDKIVQTSDILATYIYLMTYEDYCAIKFDYKMSNSLFIEIKVEKEELEDIYDNHADFTEHARKIIEAILEKKFVSLYNLSVNIVKTFIEEMEED